MVTLTPAAKGKGRESQGSFSMFYLVLLIAFGAFSFVQMVRSKHLLDHGETKPSLRRDDRATVSAAGRSGSSKIEGELMKIGADHNRHVASLEHLSSHIKSSPQEATALHTESTTKKGEAAGGKENGIFGSFRKGGMSPTKSESSAGTERGVTKSTVKAIASYFTSGKKEKKEKPGQIDVGGELDPAAGVELETNGKLHAVTYASHGGRDDRFCRALESAIRHDYDLVILGWGVKWKGLSQKLEAAQSYAASINANDLMLFTDAFDVLFAERPIVVQTEFEKLKADIVFSGECGCWPHVMEKKGRPCFEAYPKAPTPYRYLNSGTWIGRASKASAMLKEVIKEAGADFANANDQKLVADFYIAGRFGIVLDFYNKIFQSMHMTLDPPLPHCDPTQDVQVTGDGRFYNKLTKSRPAIFHFNGGGKKVHLKMEGQVWYKHKENNTPEKIRQLRSFMVATPNKINPQHRTRFDQLCPGYLTTVTK